MKRFSTIVTRLLLLSTRLWSQSTDPKTNISINCQKEEIEFIKGINNPVKVRRIIETNYICPERILRWLMLPTTRID
jgi:hypothetical protein